MGADCTTISSKIRTELGKPQSDGKIRRLKVSDGNQLTLQGSVKCEVEWNRCRHTKKQIPVVHSDKEFGLIGRDVLHKPDKNIVTEHLPAISVTKLM